MLAFAPRAGNLAPPPFTRARIDSRRVRTKARPPGRRLARSAFLRFSLPVKLAIRLLRISELRAAGQHIERHAQESGRGSDIVFAPFHDLDREAYEEARHESWRRATDVPGWERCFGAFDEERMVAHVDLTGGTLYSSL